MEVFMTRFRIALGVAAALAAVTATASAKDITIPKGTYLELRTETPFDNDTAKKGDTFTATVVHGLSVEGQAAIPAGSTVTGTIKSVKTARDGAKSGAVGVKFETLTIGGQAHPIGGVLVSLKADERRKILDQQGKIATGRKVDVILIGEGTEANMKVNTLVGISGADTDDLADEWAKSGLGPAVVRVTPGTNLTMELDKALTLPSGSASAGAAEDRNIYTSADTVKSMQRA